jgi:nucleoside-diphosphate-sugar epimerase
MNLDKNATVYVAGHRGLAGSAIWRRLEAQGYTRLVGRTSAELDLRDRDAVFEFFSAERPQSVVIAAARVGGILANDSFPADFLSDNLRIQVNVMDAAQKSGVDRLLFLGSSCIYPRLAPQPHQGGVPPDRPPRADQRRLRDREDRRDHAGPGGPAPVRQALDLRHAHQPLRARRQLLTSSAPTSCLP